MIVIKESEPQPLDCKKCKCKYGYRVIQIIEKTFEMHYDAHGKPFLNLYNETDKIIRQLKTTYCTNCGTKLPFRVS